MLSTPYVASLRIYEPLDCFAESDRQRWSQLSTEIHTGKQEQLSALRRLVQVTYPSIGIDGAHIIVHKGSRYVAPWSTAQRCWAALNEFKSSLPSSVISMFFPNGHDLDEWHSEIENSSNIPHIMTETWIIPPRWFALFSPDERLRGHNSDGAFTIMRTEMELAKQRCIATHRTVRSAFGPGPVEEELVHLLNWLNVFNSRSIVECDYGGLAIYLERSLKKEDQAGLEADTSIEDVHSSIEGLASGDGVQAGQGYERLVSRWRRVAAFEQAM